MVAVLLATESSYPKRSQMCKTLNGRHNVICGLEWVSSDRANRQWKINFQRYDRTPACW